MKSRLVAVLIVPALALLAFAACSDDTAGPHVGHGEDGNVSWSAQRDSSTNYLTTVVWITSEPWRDTERQDAKGDAGAALQPLAPGLRAADG